jgi:hypothetical protein
MFTQGAQTYDAGEEEKQEVLIANEGGVNLSQMLENRSPPKVDKKKVGYVTRGSNKRKASNSKIQILKKNGCFWGKNSKKCYVQVVKEQEANEETHGP